MIESYKDYLLEKPLCLIFWELLKSPEPLKKIFSEIFEIKEINNTKDLIYWLKISEVRIIILGIKELEIQKEMLNFLNEKLPIEKRRKIFLILILPQAKTLDPKETFRISANLVIAEDHLLDFERLYQRSLQYWSDLYKEFNFVSERLREEF